MITKPTVLVLGAGASAHLDYPSGEGLVDKIQEVVAPFSSSREEMVNQGIPHRHIDDFAIEFGGSQTLSIDEFLAHRPEYMDIGRYAIAEVLLGNEDFDKLNLRAGSWYAYLCNRLATNKEKYSNNKLSIITFNYDRSLDYCLFGAIKSRYGLDDDEAYTIYSSIEIIHVHGKLGKLPFESRRKTLDYGKEPKGLEIFNAAKGLKIIHEDIDNAQEFEAAHSLLNAAERIIFLGFGYNLTNMKRLQIPFDQKKEIIGTSLGRTDLENKVLQEIFPDLELPGRELDAYNFLRECITL